MPRLLSRQKLKDVEALIRKGLTERVICIKLSVSRKTVQNVRRRIGTVISRNKRGRKPKLGPAAKRRCVRLYTSGECDTVTDIKTKIQPEIQSPVSRRTITRALAEFSVTPTKKKKVPFLSEKNRKARLAFARKYKDWDSDDWSKVIFSDETKINRYLSDGIAYCLKRDGEPRNHRHMNQTVKGGGGNVKMWGCMTFFG